MFELENLKKSNYLMNHLNPNLEIESKFIFNERSVQAITPDPSLIEAVNSQPTSANSFGSS